VAHRSLHRRSQPARRPSAGRLARKGLSAAAKYLILMFFLLITLGPVLWVYTTAFRADAEIMSDPLGLPQEWRLENFSEAWRVGKFDHYFINSVIIAAPVVLGVVGLSCLAGYALARFKFRGNRTVFMTFLVGLMVPFQAVMIPLYFDLRDWGILSTYWAVILPSIGLGLPFGIFLMRAFFVGIPVELGDSAKVDGCNEFQVFWKVMLPLTIPAASALGIFQFMWTWNSFLMPMLYLQREELRTLPLGVMLFSGRYSTQYGLFFAGVTIATLPVVIAYILLQRRVTAGLTAGAVKG
jgi:ABC-type glycerol-3-phosphate transport system permease component